MHLASFWGLLLIPLLFVTPSLAADQAAGVVRDAASSDTSHRAEARPSGFPNLMSYVELMSYPERTRQAYLDEVRQALVDFESRTSDAYAANQPAKMRFVAEFEELYRLFVDSAAADEAKYCKCGNDQLYPAASISAGPNNVWGCPGKIGCSVVSSSGAVLTGKDLNAGTAADAVRLNTGAPALANAATGAAAVGTMPPGPTAAPTAAPTYTPYDPKDYATSTTKAGQTDKFDDFYDTAKKSDFTKKCGLTSFYQCSNIKAGAAAKGKCIIGGVISEYKKVGSSKRLSCGAVATLCFDKKGNQKTGAACSGADVDKTRVFKCGTGKTVCNTTAFERRSELGSTNGAFCAPTSGNGSQSASALCSELSDKYSSSKGGKTVSDVLSGTGDAASAENRWKQLNEQYQSTCGKGKDAQDRTTVNVTRSNCDACNVLAYRMRKARYAASQKCDSTDGSGGESDYQKNIKKYWNKNQSGGSATGNVN